METSFPFGLSMRRQLTSLVYLVVNHMEVALCVSVLGSVRMYQLIELNLFILVKLDEYDNQKQHESILSFQGKLS